MYPLHFLDKLTDPFDALILFHLISPLNITKVEFGWTLLFKVIPTNLIEEIFIFYLIYMGTIFFELTNLLIDVLLLIDQKVLHLLNFLPFFCSGLLEFVKEFEEGMASFHMVGIVLVIKRYSSEFGYSFILRNHLVFDILINMLLGFRNQLMMLRKFGCLLFVFKQEDQVRWKVS